MPMICKLCHHDRRKKADEQILEGKSNRTIAARFGVTATGVQRHRKHVAESLVRAYERRSEKAEDELVEISRDLYAKATEVYEKARCWLTPEMPPPQGLNAVANALEGMRRHLETRAKLMGRLGSGDVTINQQINLVQIAPVIYQVLQKYPAALKAVEGALLEAPKESAQ